MGNRCPGPRDKKGANDANDAYCKSANWYAPALCFGFLCLALVFMVGQGVIMLGRVNAGTDTIVNMRMPRVEMTRHMLGEVNDIAVALRNMLLSDDAGGRALQVEEVVSSRKELDARLAKLDGLLVHPQARAVLAQEMHADGRYDSAGRRPRRGSGGRPAGDA